MVLDYLATTLLLNQDVHHFHFDETHFQSLLWVLKLFFI